MNDRRLPALTGLRGLAALWVLVFHAWALSGAAGAGLPAPMTALLGAGWLGVDVFFVLSGFLLARGLGDELAGGERRPDWTAFALMRVARILPAYYAQLAVFALPAAAVVLTPAIAWTPASNGEVLAHVLLWLNAWPWMPAHLGPWWSLPVEAGFYAALPLLWWAWGSSRRMLGLLLATAILAVAWRFAMHDVTGIEQRIGWSEHLPGRLVQFVAGMALAWWMAPTGREGRECIAPESRGGGRATPWADALVLLAFAALVLLPQLGGDRAYVGIVDARVWTWFWPLLTTVPVAVLLLALVRCPEGRVARLLGSAPLVALGTVSFGLYLWHYPVQWALRAALGGYVPPSWGLAAYVVASLLLSLAAASLSWWAIERPVLAAARRWRERRRVKLRAP
ncbi:acyltransferase [Silanimonas sp.]|uniref:acyltransferase family protein n=1 Tax=Silanimonas sp. TaxID=1929290 RepID=UPI0022C04D00|nr:acyltransferase [Silanimonas sp.]MCZ8114493.1 acyltransferase [Silanimonas sp.]